MNPESLERARVTLSSEVPDEPEVNYELDPALHELTSRYRPKYLAKGGEHIVYDIPEHPEVVVKVNASSLKRAITWNIEHDESADSLPRELELGMRQSLSDQSERQQTLKVYFGSEHVPSQKGFLLKVPVTEDILRALYREAPPAMTTEAWSFVTIQKRVEALADPERLTLVCGYAEFNKETDQDLYRKVTEHYVFGKDPEKPMCQEDMLAVQHPSELATLLERAKSDEDLHTVLKDLVERIIVYAEETGEILDIAGQDNIILFKKDDAWTYSLVDARYPGESDMMERAKSALRKISEGERIDSRESGILLNSFNFVRTVNGLAELIGVHKRITIVPEDMKYEGVDFFNLVRE